MAIAIDCLDIRGLRKTHFNQLKVYLEWAEQEGTYYGNREQFAQRHTELKHWMEHVVDLLNKSDVVIPKNVKGGGE